MDVGNLHLAVLVPGCAQLTDAGLGVSSRVGPLVERLAELVGHTTVLAYDPPTSNPKQEDRVDFVMTPEGGRISFVSLGPKGTYREYFARRRRISEIVERVSPTWDLLFMQLVNRRAGLVFARSRCARVVAQTGGHTPTVIRSSPTPMRRKFVSLLGALVAERSYRKIARRSLFFVNGEALLPHYVQPGATVEVLRTSARRAAHAFIAEDRLTSDEPQLMMVGRLTVAKGVFETLHAFRIVRESVLPNATLHVVGSGDLDEALKARAVELGIADATVFHGWIPPGEQLFSLFQRMDVMLTLSLAESLPKTVWESQAHSVLVVATPVGAMPDVFTHEQDLLFVPTGDPSAAADAVRRLAEEPALRQRLLTRGRETAAEASVEAVADKLLRRVVEEWPELDNAEGAS